MKRFLGTASLLLLAGSPVLAVAGQPPSGWIVSLRGGPTVAQTNSGELDRQLTENGHSVTTDLDSRDLAGVMSLSYRLNSLTAVEVSVGTLGEYKVAATGTSPNPAQLSEDLVDEKPAGGRFLGFGLRQDLPLIRDQLALTVRAAAIGWRQESTVNNGLTSTTFQNQDLGWMLGLATTYKISPAVGLSVGGDWYDQGEHGAIGLLHVGADYHF